MPSLTDFAGENDSHRDGSDRTVLALCSDCGDRHPVAARTSADDTPASTVCPECGSPAYTSEVVDE